MAPLATLAMTSVTDVPTLPASLIVVARTLVTVSTVAWAMLPVPLIAATILAFTVSIMSECVPFILVFFRFNVYLFTATDRWPASLQIVFAFDFPPRFRARFCR